MTSLKYDIRIQEHRAIISLADEIKFRVYCTTIFLKRIISDFRNIVSLPV